MKIFFTDLDGTLLDENYSYEKAREGLRLIKKNKNPLVFCTSKTRAETELYRKRLGNNDPFISENGGAIFIPRDYFKFDFDYDKELGNYFVIKLGIPYEELRKVLGKIKKHGFEIIGFGDMSIDEIAEDTRLSIDEAKMAKDREYDEAFRLIKGDEGSENKLIDLIKQKGLNYTKGGRYWHILKSDKGKAVKILSELFRRQYNDIDTIGIGDSENDFEMLNNVDNAYLIMRGDGAYASENYRKAKGISSEGFNNVVKMELG